MIHEALQNARLSVGWVDAVVPYVSPKLLSCRARARVRSALPQLPGAATHLYLECRLRRDDDQVDVIVGVPRRVRGRLFKERWMPHRGVRASRSGARLEAFARRWAADAPELRVVTGLW